MAIKALLAGAVYAGLLLSAAHAQTLTATPISATQINLTWPIAANTAYVLTRNGALLIVTTPGSYSDIGLLPGTAYNYSLSGTTTVITVFTATASATTLPQSNSSSVYITASPNPYTDGSGQVWQADTSFCTPANVVNGSGTVSGTPDPTLYLHERYAFASSSASQFQCSFALAPGSYTLRVKFAENYWTAAGKRQFNVLVNGVPWLSIYDIFAAAGGMRIAHDESFPFTTATGAVAIVFQSILGKDNAKYDSLAVTPAGPPVPPTIASLGPSAGPVGTPVLISGTNFAPATSSSQTTVSFNGTPAAAANITAGSLNTSVPIGASTGPVVVTANGLASNGVPFTVTTVTAHSVSLSWTASASANVAGYNIYRSSTSGGPYTKLNLSLLTAAAFTDSGVLGGQTYYYVATAVDTQNNESTDSNEAQATVPA